MIKVTRGHAAHMAIGDIVAGRYFTGAIGDHATPILWFRGDTIFEGDRIIAWAIMDGASVGKKHIFDRNESVFQYSASDVNITVKA